MKGESKEGWRYRRVVASVDGEKGDLVDLGTEDGELSAVGGEGEAGIARREFHPVGEEGFVAREGNPEGEPVPPLDLGVGARGEDAVLVASVHRRRQQGHHQRHRRRRHPHPAADLPRSIEGIGDLGGRRLNDGGLALSAVAFTRTGIWMGWSRSRIIWTVDGVWQNHLFKIIIFPR